MRFPIVLKTPEAGKPDATIYYEIASNGPFQVRDFPIYRAVTRTDELVPGLHTQEESLEIKFPRLPAALLAEVLDFFCEVYRRHGGEAIVILLYHPAQKVFRARVPPQTISQYRDYKGRWKAYMDLKYKSVARPKDFLRLGTIHSHPNMPAYASATDCDDERFEDGLHIVFGDLDMSRITRSASFVANGVRFRLKPSEVMEPFSQSDREAPPDWMACVEVERRSAPPKQWVWAGDPSAATTEIEITSTEIEPGDSRDGESQSH